jgi:hypothetical protein
MQILKSVPDYDEAFPELVRQARQDPMRISRTTMHTAREMLRQGVGGEPAPPTGAVNGEQNSDQIHLPTPAEPLRGGGQQSANEKESDQQSAVDRPAGTPSETPPAPKRSTEKGEAREKLISALNLHHQYADAGCLNCEPIGNNALARLANVSNSSASLFFNEEFEGHMRYRAVCRDSILLAAALKLLNNEFAPHNLYGRRPAHERDRDDEVDA